MDVQRLRNLTTGRLHTEIDHIYEDLETITGEKGLMIHMLPRAMDAVEPWLREHVTEPRFWNDEYDTTHTGDIDLPEPTEADRNAMFERYERSEVSERMSNANERHERIARQRPAHALTVEKTMCEHCGNIQETVKPWKHIPVCCHCRKPMVTV
jgi:hypothetical protein